MLMWTRNEAKRVAATSLKHHLTMEFRLRYTVLSKVWTMKHQPLSWCVMATHTNLLAVKRNYEGVDSSNLMKRMLMDDR